MNIDELGEMVDQYFSVHLDRVYWQGLDKATRAGAVQMAVNDIAVAIPGISLEALGAIAPAVNAIAEQAVYLARNYARQTFGRVVTGEGVDGISNSYALLGDNPGISFRAEPFIKEAKRLVRGNSVRIARG